MAESSGTQRSQVVERYFRGLQQRIVDALSALDGQPFRRDSWTRPAGGGGISCLIEEGNLIERGGVNFSHVMGTQLPPLPPLIVPSLPVGRMKPWVCL